MNYLSINKPAWDDLASRRERLPHALLLIGQQGLGKFELARCFAASLLCEQPAIDGLACGNCLACNWFVQGNHPDFRLLQPDALAEAAETGEGKKKPSQQITIDQVRDLNDFLGVGSHRGGLSIVLVNPAEAMNRNAANALLKTLEEPPPSTLFLLVSGEPARLLTTIRSRCQVVPVAVPRAEIAVPALQAAGVADAAQWLALAGGSPRLALELAGTGQGAWIQLLVSRLATGGKIDPLGLAGEFDKLLKDGKGKLLLRHLVELLQKWIVDLNLAKHGLPVRYFLAQQSQIAVLADMISAMSLIHMYRSMNTHRLEAEQPLNARLFLEGLFLDYRALFGRERG